MGGFQRVPESLPEDPGLEAGVSQQNENDYRRHRTPRP